MNEIIETLSAVTNFIETIKEYLPWFIVIVITQMIKKAYFDKLIEWLRISLCLLFPFILSLLIFFVFAMPEFEFWSWLQSSIYSFGASILGFNIGNNVVKIIKAYLAKGK